MILQFTVNGEPVAKGRPKFSTRGGFARTYTPAKTRHAEETLAARAMQYAPPTPASGPLFLSCHFYFPYPKSMPQKRRGMARHTVRPDLDNCIKLLKDAFNGVFWIDDKQIVGITASKQYGDVPRTEVRIDDEDTPF